MANLSAMFGKKTPDATPSEPVAPATVEAAPAAPSVEAEATPDSSVSPAPIAARKGLGFLGKSSQANANPAPVSAADATPTAQAKPKLAGLSLGKAQPVAAPAVHPAESDEDQLIDLDALMNDESPAPVRKPAPVPADHVPATSPIRPVPDDATPAMLKFVDLIDSVYEIQFDQELLGNVIKSIMVELQTNPAYISADWKKSLVQPDDIRVWIANMREVMGLNKIVKAEKKAKRATSKAKKVDSNEMLDDLASLGFTMDV